MFLAFNGLTGQSNDASGVGNAMYVVYACQSSRVNMLELRTKDKPFLIPQVDSRF